MEIVDELPSIIEVQLNLLGVPHTLQKRKGKFKDPKNYKSVKQEDHSKSFDRNGEPMF